MDQHHLHEMLMTMVIALAGGAILITIARRFKTSAIILLIGSAFALGPEGLGWLHPESLGSGLRVIVSLAIGLILFEGGLTLDVKGYRGASLLIRRMLSVGVLTTWFVTAGAIKLLYPSFQVSYCLLFASLVIVTGPTVIAPLLRRIRLVPKLHNILHWEGVLIDPIGVFIALLCFEYVVGVAAGVAVMTLFLRIAAGIGFGIAGGFILAFILKRRLIPSDMYNVFSFGFAVMLFGVADAFATEAGLLSVTIAGFIVGLSRPPDLESIRHFKAEMTDILIGMLFILLSSRLKFEQFVDFGARGALLVAIVIVVVRPLALGLSAIGTDLRLKEKAFLGWVAPRGIVAASFASAVGLSLAEKGTMDEAIFVESFVYSVIIATVALQELSAGLLARFMGLQRPPAKGYMLVGAHGFARRLARFLKDGGIEPVVLADINTRSVGDARLEGLDARVIDARDLKVVEDQPDLNSVGNLIALTDNENLNALIGQRWVRQLGRERVFFWGSQSMTDSPDESIGRIVWHELPKPTLLTEELQRREASLMTANTRFTEEQAGSVQLLAAITDEEKLILGPSKDQIKDLPEKGKFLYLRREADYLALALRPQLITRTNLADLHEVFTQLVGMAARVADDLNTEQTVAALLERERTAPTALGHGVAIPHITSSDLKQRLCALAQAPNGASFEAPDGEPVRLIFMILSPADDPEGHLAILAEVARIVSDAKMRERLLEESDPGRIIEIIQGHYFPGSGEGRS